MRRIYYTLAISAILGINILGQDQKTSPANSGSQTQVAYSESTSYSPRIFPESKDKQKEKKKDPKKEASSKTPVAPPPVSDAIEQTLDVPVSVLARDGKIVSGLTQADFRVFVDDKRSEIVSIKTNDEPLNIILLLDMSPSADVQNKRIKALASSIVEQLRPDDKVMVVGFNQAVKVAAELTSDRAIVAKGIQRLQMDDGTSLYNAVSELFENRLSSITGPTAVIIMTDGVDTTSRKASYESSLVSAENRTATVFPVYFNTYESSQTNAAALTAIFPMMIPRRTVEMDKAEYELGRFYLSDLLRLSGGHAVVVKDGDKGKIDGLDAIPAELRARYYIRLRLPDGGKTGERHRVMIGVNQPDLIVRAKGSYIGK